MPPVSEAQRRYMRAHQGDDDELGKVAREFVAADPGGKLPKRVSDGKAVPQLSIRALGERKRTGS